MFKRNREREALASFNRSIDYQTLLDCVREAQEWLGQNVPAGSIVVLDVASNCESIAMFLALSLHRCIIVPVENFAPQEHEALLELAGAEYLLTRHDDRYISSPRTEPSAEHRLVKELRVVGHAGMILFTSGSTGTPKAVLHDLDRLFSKFTVKRKTKRVILFYLFDHVGGLDTLLHTLSNGGTVVLVDGRNPEAVCRAVGACRVEVLPASPTFLKLLLLSGQHRVHDMSTLEVIAYGTEVMPDVLLEQLDRDFPGVQLMQKFGMSELGALRSRSESNTSQWMLLGGEGVHIRVVDGILQIRAPTAMLGYLNTPSPFTPDGWFVTGDMAEVKGDYFRILGRASELINVGGQKFHPSEAESVLGGIAGVSNVTVHAEPNALTGQTVVATFSLATSEDPGAFRKRVTVFARKHLARHMRPQRVLVSSVPLHSQRYKTIRNPAARSTKSAARRE